MFPWEAFEKSAFQLLLTRGKGKLLQQDIVLVPCNPAGRNHWFLIAVFPQEMLMAALDRKAGAFVKPTTEAALLQKVDNRLDFNHCKFVANQPYDLPQHANSWDFGVFAYLYSRCLVTKSIILSDQHSIPEFRKHMILELHSQVLLPASPPNAEKDKYYAADYVNNYYIGRAISATDKCQFIQVLAQNSTDTCQEV